MQTASTPTPAPALGRGSRCHSGAQPSQSPWRRRRIAIVAGAAIIAGTAFALGAGWLAAAALAPLLYALPCALMMVACMRHMNHGERKET
jgi:hypothetical protein